MSSVTSPCGNGSVEPKHPKPRETEADACVVEYWPSKKHRSGRLCPPLKGATSSRIPQLDQSVATGSPADRALNKVERPCRQSAGVCGYEVRVTPERPIY